jgi:hypothetical protein
MILLGNNQCRAFDPLSWRMLSGLAAKERPPLAAAPSSSRAGLRAYGLGLAGLLQQVYGQDAAGLHGKSRSHISFARGL